jgi:hypothetical protein
LLVWTIFGRRLDGWTNAEHPTEFTPGNPSGLPSGVDINATDLDYTGMIMPPPGSNVPPLSEDEKMTIARWIDLGCPIDTAQTDGSPGYGWFLDDLRPTLTLSRPSQNRNTAPLTEIRVGVADANSGVNLSTLSVRADFPINGLAPEAELAAFGSFIEAGVLSIPVNPPLTNLSAGHLNASVADQQGNRTKVNVRFWVEPAMEQLRIIQLDMAQINRRQLAIRFLEPDDFAAHAVVYSHDLNQPSTLWEALLVVDSASESNHVRRLTVALPETDSDRIFLKVRRL